MIIEALQNPHYIIDFNSYEGLRNISITAFLFVSILILGRNLNKSKNIFFLKIISLIALSQTGYDHIIDIMNNNWNLEEDLPLHLCSFSNLIVISMLFIKPNKKVFEFLFYCGFLGGFVSILTPQLNYFDGGWFMYLSYYVSHSIIMLVPLYMFYNLDYKLSKYSWLRTFGILNILMVIILPLNFIIGKGSNYMYLYEAPQIKNPLVFGDWPFYIINWEVIILVLFYLTYLIFTRKRI